MKAQNKNALRDWEHAPIMKAILTPLKKGSPWHRMVEEIGMFRNNDMHLQWTLFSSIDSLPQKQQQRLEQFWAGAFSHRFFCRIDAQPFAILDAEQDSRPTTPVNVLVGFEPLKADVGRSDEEACDRFCFDVQVRYAPGSRDVSEGHFDLRTADNARLRVTQHMQATGENLQVADEQIAAFRVQTSKLRMNSALIAGNIRQTTRLQLSVEALQWTQRMPDEADQQRYGDEFVTSLKGAAGQSIYALRREDDAAHRPRIDEVMERLASELRARYGDEPDCQAPSRGFQERFIVEESIVRARAGRELSAAGLPSPDDREAAYRCKYGQGRRGCVANVSETCHPENPFRLMVNVQREPNAADDAALLAAAWPGTSERSDVDGLHTDGGDHSLQVDDLMPPPSRAAGADRHPCPSTDGGQGRPGGHDPADERRHWAARVGRPSWRTARRGCGWAQRRTLHGDL